MSLLMRRRALMAQIDKQGWDGKDCVAVGSNGYLYYSTDYGVNWSRFGSLTGVTHAHIARSSSLAADTGSSINYTVGSTAYFTRIGQTAALSSIAIGGTAANICGSGDGKIAFTSYNAGSGWQTGYTAYIRKITRTSDTAGTIVTKGTFSTWDQAAGGKSVCSVDGKYAVIGGAAGFTNGFQTVNYGEAWAECLATQSFGNGLNDIDCSVDGNAWVASSPAGQLSSYFLQSWSLDATFGANLGVSVALPTGPSNRKELWSQVGTGDNSLVVWTEEGYSVVTAPAFRIIKSNAKGDKLIAIRHSNGAVYYSHNHGRTWTATSLTGIVEISMTKYM